MKKCAIYTKTGDGGMTDLVGGVRVAKNHVRIEAYGSVDELNSQLGLLVCFLTGREHEVVKSIQLKLFQVGAALASVDGYCPGEEYVLSADSTVLLENEMDRMDEVIPPLTAFVLPGGCQAAAHAHICRAVCRRAERRVLDLSEVEAVDKKILIFLNRLSDYLFVLSRFLNKMNSSDEFFLQRSCR